MSTPILKTIPLNVPLPYGEGTLDSLTLRRPAAGELRGLKLAALQNMDVDTTFALAARIAQPTVVVEQLAQLDPSDFVQLFMAVNDFFEKPPVPSPTTPEALGAS